MEENYVSQIRAMAVRLINKQLSNKLWYVNVLFMNLNKQMLFTSNILGYIPFKDINQRVLLYKLSWFSNVANLTTSLFTR
jgi:hypothetical protein